ncbi:MAG TPA: type ISP restriction/modification enzyme [Steroidobacteraceae bacterium]|nr:type ISP restriction/modification enzyme [Steroidobacteraceae bacterium]
MGDIPVRTSEVLVTLKDFDEAPALAMTIYLGAHTIDVFLNEAAFWKNVPESVWNFTIGGYQVLKKFLSYREQPLLGRALTSVEVRFVRDVARRLAALLLMVPELDANYRACAAAHRPLGERRDATCTAATSK